MAESNAWSDALTAIDTLLDETDGDVLAVNPPQTVLHALFTAVEDTTLKVLVHEDTAKSLANGFSTASQITDLQADDLLEFRADTTDRQTAALVTDDTAIALVEAGDSVAAIQTDDDTATDVYTASHDAFDAADTYPVDAPARSTVVDSLADEFDEGMVEDVTTVLDTVSDLGTRTGLNTVDAVVLLAARNEALFYNVSQWGESIDLASKATFSRSKSRLEDAGLISTVKVPIDVGRPRLRLHLTDEYADTDPAELLAAAKTTLN